MPGTVTVTRTATNVTNKHVQLQRRPRPRRLEDQGDAGHGQHHAGQEPDLRGDDHLECPLPASTSARSTSRRRRRRCTCRWRSSTSRAMSPWPSPATRPRSRSAASPPARSPPPTTPPATPPSASTRRCLEALDITGATAHRQPHEAPKRRPRRHPGCTRGRTPAIAPVRHQARSRCRRLPRPRTVRHHADSRSVTRASPTSTSRPSSSVARATPGSASTPTATSSSAAATAPRQQFEPQTFPDPAARTVCSPPTGPTSTAAEYPACRSAASPTVWQQLAHRAVEHPRVQRPHRDW